MTSTRYGWARPATDPRPAVLGVATGLRSQAGIAALAPVGPLAFLGPERARRIAVGALAVEVVLDKMPWVPSRLRLPSLMVRIGVAAVSGRALADRDGLPLRPALIEATAGALGGSLGGAAVRAIASRGGRRGFGVAVAEDVVAAGLATLAARLPARTSTQS